MLIELTKQQKLLIPIIRNKWIDRFNNCEKIDKKEAKKGIEWLYKISNLDKPTLLFVDSPLGCQYAANTLINLLKESKVGSEVRSKVESEVWSKVGSEVWSKVGSEVRSKVGSEVRSEVGSEVRSKVRSEVGSEVESKVELKVGSEVESKVRSKVNKVFSFCSYGSIWDYVWCSYYDYFKKIGIIKNNDFNKFVKLLESNLYDCIQLEKICIVCSMPKFINRDEMQNLHSIEFSAIEWADTYSLNFIHGVYFNKSDWKTISNIILTQQGSKKILELPNIEQRMAALKAYGIDKVIKDMNLIPIDTSLRGNSLFKLTEGFDTPVYFLRYECPSTGRVYMSGINPHCLQNQTNNLADRAMSWKFGLNLNEYNNLRIEA